MTFPCVVPSLLPLFQITATCEPVLNTSNPSVKKFYNFADTLYMLDATLLPIIIQATFNTCFRAALFSVLCCLCPCRLTQSTRHGGGRGRRRHGGGGSLPQGGSTLSMSTSVSAIAFSETNVDDGIESNRYEND